MPKKKLKPVQIEIHEKVKRSLWRLLFLFMAAAFFFAVGALLLINAYLLHTIFFNLQYELLFYFIAFLFLLAGIYSTLRFYGKNPD